MSKTDIITDGVLGLSKGVLSLIPSASVFLAAVDEIRKGVLQRKHEQWMKEMGERIKALEDEVRNKLGDNEMFATTLLRATQLAITSKEEKMTYLANAVKYSAENDIEEDYLIIFLNCIERYTVSHIQLLEFCRNPQEKVGETTKTMSSVMTLYREYAPNLPNGIEKVIIRDLFADGFIDTDSLTSTSSIHGCLSKKTTPFGDKFLDFIGV